MQPGFIIRNSLVMVTQDIARPIKKIINILFPRKVVLQSGFYLHFRSNMLRKDLNACYGLNSITSVLLQWCLWHYITHKVDMPLNKVTKPKPNNYHI